MHALDEELLKAAKFIYPDAENDVTALDEYAGQIYKELQEQNNKQLAPEGKKEYDEKVEIYWAVLDLRERKLNEAIECQSGISIESKESIKSEVVNA
jgi:aspartyl-tRNA synthetase